MLFCEDTIAKGAPLVEFDARQSNDYSLDELVTYHQAQDMVSVPIFREFEPVGVLVAVDAIREGHNAATISALLQVAAAELNSQMGPAPMMPYHGEERTSESRRCDAFDVELIGVDAWSVVVAHLLDGELAFALTCNMLRDAVRKHRRSHSIRSTVAHAITSKARLQWALAMGCPRDAVSTTAAANGKLAVLAYARSLKLPWVNVCTAAAANGHLDCLKYAHKNGSAWDETTSTAAAANGHLPCLKYAHSNGCAWNASPDLSACAAAAANGNLDCLKYAHIMVSVGRSDVRQRGRQRPCGVPQVRARAGL